MYRIWIGLQPKAVMAAVFGAVAMIVLVIHLFAFRAIGYPGSVKATYPTYAAPTR